MNSAWTSCPLVRVGCCSLLGRAVHWCGRGAAVSLDELSTGVGGVLQSPWMSCPLVRVGCCSLLLLSCCCQFLLSCLSVSVLCVEVLLCWVHQFSSVAQSCPTLCDPMNRSTPGLPVRRYLRRLCHPTGGVPGSLCSVLPYLLSSALF